jgi:uncharacterized damage-inducible protein DinB
MLNHLHKQFAYNNWANNEAFASLDRMSPAPPRAVPFLAHILAAERLWLMRLQRVPTDGFDVWPRWNIEQCEREMPELTGLWDRYLQRLTPDTLKEIVPYRNSKGEEWRNSVLDVLTHVIIHSGYHRGQIAAEVRRFGGEPAYTDYIHALRQSLIE